MEKNSILLAAVVPPIALLGFTEYSTNKLPHKSYSLISDWG